MKVVTVRGLACLTALLALSVSSAFCADSLYLSQASTGESSFGTGTDSSFSSLSNPAIDRLLVVNDSEAHVTRTSASVTPAERPRAERTQAAAAPVADLSSSVPVTSSNRGYMMLTACGAILALGVGLCCAGVMSGRQRTVTTFTAGFVNFK